MSGQDQGTEQTHFFSHVWLAEAGHKVDDWLAALQGGRTASTSGRKQA